MWGPEARYLFDTFGYAVLRGALREEAPAMLAAVAANRSSFHENVTAGISNANGATYQGAGGRLDCGTAFSWPDPHGRPFRQVLDHPNLVPALHDLVGPGYRLDHLPLCFVQRPGAEGFDLHGGAVKAGGVFDNVLRYDCRGGAMFTTLLAVSVNLSTVKAGDGGFACLPGSHKANFPLPDELKERVDLLTQPAMEPGDVLLFTEALTHGALPWRAEHDRVVALYRFSPATAAYGRAAVETGWPSLAEADLTLGQRAALAPPYHPRLDRPNAGQAPRAEHKKAFDERVFGNTYF